MNVKQQANEAPTTTYPVIRQIRRGSVRFSVAINDDGESRFWNKFETGRWEPETLRALDEHLDSRTVFVDIGGWIGPTAIFAAARGCRVVTVEADPEALSRLRANLALNPDLAQRIEIIDRALYPVEGSVSLSSYRKPGDSMSSIVHEPRGVSWTVETVTPAQLAKRISGAERYFLKIDIEGGEYANFPAMEALFRLPLAGVELSMHPEFALGGTRGIRRIVSWWKLALKTSAMFHSLSSMRIFRLTSRNAHEAPSIERLSRWGLTLRPLPGSWLFVPR